MQLDDFINTIYFGDRGCKSIILDGWNDEVKIQITCISRIRAESWNYYTDEDVENGYLVFEKIKSIHFDPPGFIPNDTINDINVEKLQGDFYKIILNISSADLESNYTCIDVQIVAKTLAIEDPKYPNIRIRD
ncbi:DUF6258 family protein [Leptospira sp. WS92.C1]